MKRIDPVFGDISTHFVLGEKDKLGKILDRPPIFEKKPFPKAEFPPFEVTTRIQKVPPLLDRIQTAPNIDFSRYRLKDFIKDDGVPKEHLLCPVSPTGVISDEVLFQLPKAPFSAVYLPRYRVATELVSGKEQFQIALIPNQGGNGGKLTVYLEKFPAPVLSAAVANATEMPHTLVVTLIIKQTSGMTKSLGFQELVTESKWLKATLNVGTLLEFTEILLALSGKFENAQLSLQRQLQVAAPATTPVSAQELDPAKHVPALILIGKTQSASAPMTEFQIAVQNSDLFPDELFAAAPDLPPCGLNTNASRTWVNIFAKSAAGDRYIYGFCALGSNKNLKKLWFVYPNTGTNDETFYVQLNDRRTNRLYNSNLISLHSEPTTLKERFRLKTETMETILPFVFPSELFGYIYKNISQPTQSIGQYIEHRVERQGKLHFYLQDYANRQRFFYLPDEFRLARTADMPWKPDMLIHYMGQQIETLKVKLDYKLLGFIDEKRITNAKIALQKTTGLTNIFFEPLLLGSEKLNYQLNLPTGLVKPPSALVNLTMIEDILEFDSIEDFKNVYERLSSVDNREGVLTGKIELSLEHFSIPYIPVTIRLNNMVGQIFNMEQTFDTTLKGHHITLTNMIESNVSFKNLTAKLQIGEFEWTADLTNLTIPEQLSTGSSLKFEVVVPAAADISVERLNTGKIVFEWVDLKVILNKAAVYDAMLGNTNTQPYQKTILVGFFGLNTASIKAVQIKVKSAKNSNELLGSATFSGDKLSADNHKMSFKPPIRDYILSTATQYFYQLLVIDKDGKEFLGEWEDYLGDDLLVTSDKINTVISKTLQGAAV
jgi:hypothetical protein